MALLYGFILRYTRFMIFWSFRTWFPTPPNDRLLRRKEFFNISLMIHVHYTLVELVIIQEDLTKPYWCNAMLARLNASSSLNKNTPRRLYNDFMLLIVIKIHHLMIPITLFSHSTKWQIIDGGAFFNISLMIHSLYSSSASHYPIIFNQALLVQCNAD